MLIAGNWKLFKTQAETRAFCQAFSPPGGVEIVICPPYTSLAVAITEVASSTFPSDGENVTTVVDPGPAGDDGR